MKDALRMLAAGESLDTPTVERSMRAILDGDVTPAQIGAFLGMLAAKGETVDELVATVRVIRERSVSVPARAPLTDLCGTGGDGLGTFNVSTAASFVAATAGVRVAKHGNRAASGTVGAADVLEHLGVRLDLTPRGAGEAIERFGIAFLFAPAFHPSLRVVSGARRELGLRTIFNLAGPLANPAGARRQVIGVFAAQWLEPFARAAIELGADHVLVVHGSGGADELTPVGPARAVESDGTTMRSLDLDASDFGIARCSVADLKGGTVMDNAEILKSVLSGSRGARSDTVALNAGAAIYVGGVAGSISDGIAVAFRVLESGKAWKLFEQYRSYTQQAEIK